MSRYEIYPWSLMTEVGDYFIVPYEFKPADYIQRLCAQKNYKRDSPKRYAAHKTGHGTIVMLIEIHDEEPPFEFVSPEGIKASTSRSYLKQTAVPVAKPVGDVPQRPKRTQQQMINMMSREVKMQNLPWWFENDGKRLQVNPNIIREPELTLWHNGELRLKPDTPYPEHYDLDENYMRRSPVPDEEDDESVEDQWAGISAEGDEGE